MKKLLLSIFLISIFSGFIFAQVPFIQGTLTVTDNNGGTQLLRFGVDPAATNGFDAIFGELELPPIPPPGIFDARLIGDDIGINLGQGLARDYRQGVGNEQRIHEIKYQVGSGSTITINWNLPFGMKGRLQDVGSGTVVDVDMSGVGSYTVTNPASINKLKVTTTYKLPVLTITDNAGGTKLLRFGLAPSATDGIDASLDELEMPPTPPAGIFDARFIGDDIGINIGQGLDKDIRQGYDTSNIIKTHEIKYQPGSGTTITINWSFPVGLAGRLQDLGGGAVVDVNMMGTGSYTVTNPISINKLKINARYATIPAAPTLVSPADGAQHQPINITLSWSAVWNADNYRLQVATNSSFTNIVYDDSTLTTTSKQIGPLQNITTYYWRVLAKNIAGSSAWSPTWSFITIVPIPAAPTLLAPANGAVNQPITLTLSWNAVQYAETYRLQVATDAGFTNLVVNDSTLTTTSKQVGPLQNITQYYWRVNAKNIAGTGNYSTVWNFTTIVPIPVAPTLVSPANGATNQPITLTLSWNAVQYAETYRLQVATDAGFTNLVFNDSTITTTSKQVGPLQNITTYYWRVNAKNIAGTGPYSTVRNFVTIVPIPQSPTLSAPPNGALNQPINLTLSWNAVQYAETYRLQVATDAGFTNLVVNDSTLTTTSKLVGPLANNTKYYWRVNAKNIAGTGAYSTVWDFTTIVPIPVAPVLSAPANGSVNQPITLTLSWNAVNFAETYRLQVATDAAFTNLVFNDSTITTTSKQVGPLQNNTKYYWRVNAKNIAGTSPYSTVWDFTTIVPVPVAPTLTSPANGSVNQPITITLSWSTVQYAETYRLQVATDNAFTNLVVNDSTLTTNSKQVTLLNNTKYYWRVNAKNIAGTGPYSAVWDFTTIVPIPAAPTLISPANNSTNLAINQTFTWNSVQFAATYRLQVATDSVFSASALVVNDSMLTTTSKAVTLQYNKKYWWRVNAKNIAGTGAYSAVWNLKTLNPVPTPFELVSPIDNNRIFLRRNNSTQINLKWTKSTWGAEYRFRFGVPYILPYYLDIKSNNNGTDTTLTFTEGQLHTLLDTTMLFGARDSIIGQWAVWAFNEMRQDSTRSTSAFFIKFVLERPSGIDDDQIPTVYSLSQNYPNPFNPNTVIKFGLPVESKVVLKVYNMIGQEVATLVDNILPAGYHKIPFEPKNLGSGIYLYRLKAGDFVSTKKMMLIK